MAKTMKRISVISLLLTICFFVLYKVTDYRDKAIIKRIKQKKK